jgi:hypothetical protein
MCPPTMLGPSTTSSLSPQQQHLNRIAEIIVIELLASDAVKLHRRVGRDHEIKRRAQGTLALERRRKSARRDLEVASIALLDLVGRHGVGHRLGRVHERLRLRLRRAGLRK